MACKQTYSSCPASSTHLCASRLGRVRLRFHVMPFVSPLLRSLHPLLTHSAAELCDCFTIQRCEWHTTSAKLRAPMAGGNSDHYRILATS